MSIGSQRLLGLAFASADLLIEVAPDGLVAFVLGASEVISGSAGEALLGRPWRSVIEAADRPMVEALFDGLESGQRGGPVVVRFASPDGVARAASLSAFTLPENGGAVSCALSLATPEAALAPGELPDRKSFEDLTAALLQTAQSSGADLELALIEMAGLAAARETVAPEDRQDLETRLAGVMRAQAHGGSAATELGAERFALVRARGETPETLVRRVARLMDTGLGTKIEPAADVMSLKGDVQSRQAVRALRYSLDSFLRDGMDRPTPANLSDALSQAMQRTLDDVGALGLAIREKRFRLVYQPVVSLLNGAVHHYETLVRFGEEESPFPLIRMAEEMDLIEPLDLAILERALQTLGRDAGLKLAVNVSGRTIVSPQFIEQACAMIAAQPKTRGRLMFELTESAALDDLALADRHLQALREHGCEICLDDFGAGAASLAYLQQLRLDVLKIDGRYIRDLQHGGREATFVKHLVKMCGELGIRTLAEMVETKAAEDAVRRAGVHLAQGWLYGAAADTPQAAQGPEIAKPKVRPALGR
ncbi:EAL domain-containing protein [Phenylobacterium hankyongense]|uniref:EAL domain-containing protein n=1 Tax=Phenylobacterium hankyongense TaxID=1813876 RepID=A0A328AY84_9CAUL|nr:EAL domain-containing protein [Phenylobacterium hankyongense]RAK58564.1 EAL domain-containing protein [Phenylobacterium hankyongense]